MWWKHALIIKTIEYIKDEFLSIKVVLYSISALAISFAALKNKFLAR